MNKNSDNKIKLTFHPAEFGAKMPIPLAEQSVKAGFPSPAQDYMEGEIDLNDIRFAIVRPPSTCAYPATACRMQAFRTVISL